MAVTVEDLRAELQRLNELEVKAWAELNQIIGAKNQLAVLIEAWDTPEPQSQSDPPCSQTPESSN